MPQLAQFEEKEFETAANGELYLGGFLMAPGQVLEAVVGYDAVAAPHAEFVIWQILQVPRPAGIRLVPRHWQLRWDQPRRPDAARLPVHPVSLLVQYKRPELVDHPRGGQWHYWKRSYFRFRCRGRQHRTLVRLEGRLRAAAVVRYCSPAFLLSSELEAAIVTHTTLRRSGWVSPRGIGNHTWWTYVGPGTQGFANPTRKALRFESTFELFASLRRPTSRSSELELTDNPQQRLIEHLRELERAVRPEAPRKIQADVALWQERIRRLSLPLSESSVQQLGTIALIATVLGDAEADWHVVDAQDEWEFVGI